jgi:hypothetical protein
MTFNATMGSEVILVHIFTSFFSLIPRFIAHINTVEFKKK